MHAAFLHLKLFCGCTSIVRKLFMSGQSQLICLVYSECNWASNTRCTSDKALGFGAEVQRSVSSHTHTSQASCGLQCNLICTHMIAILCLAHINSTAVQDDHILARKYADKWMVKALGVGLFKRKLHRREVEDTRQLLMSTINPLARVSSPITDWVALFA